MARGPLKRDHKGRPILIEMPRRMEIMESASSALWEALKRCSITDLKALQPTGPFIPLIDALIDIRLLMGEDPHLANELDDLARRHRRTTLAVR